MSVQTYKCRHCEAQFGLIADYSVSEDDWAAEEFYDAEVEFHESGECSPEPTPIYEQTVRALQRRERRPDLLRHVLWGLAVVLLIVGAAVLL